MPARRTSVTTWSTALRSPDTNIEVMLQLQQIEAGDGRLGDVRLAPGRLEHAAAHAGTPRLAERSDDLFGLAPDLKIGALISIGVRGDVGSADDHRLAAGMAHRDEFERVGLLHQHAPGHHQVGPGEIVLRQRFSIAIDETDRPRRWKQGGNSNEAERTRRVPGADDLTRACVAPERTRGKLR